VWTQLEDAFNKGIIECLDNKNVEEKRMQILTGNFQQGLGSWHWFAYVTYILARLESVDVAQPRDQSHGQNKQNPKILVCTLATIDSLCNDEELIK
jgi:hypothetical protein